jgi:hypothetical protein
LLPTPAAQEPGGTPERFLERKNAVEGGTRTTPTFLALAVQLLPTPGAWLGRRPENSYADPERAASRAHTTGRRGDRSVELPDVLALLSGESTNPPSDGGNDYSDEPLLNQLTIEDA